MNFFRVLQALIVNRRVAIARSANIRNGGNSSKEQTYAYYNQV